jgi:hypothetical protein
MNKRDKIVQKVLKQFEKLTIYDMAYCLDIQLRSLWSAQIEYKNLRDLMEEKRVDRLKIGTEKRSSDAHS